MSEKKLSRKKFEEVLLDITFLKKNNSNYHIVNTNNEMVHRDSKKGFNYCLQTEIGISSNNLFQYFVVLLNVKRKIFCENDLKNVVENAVYWILILYKAVLSTSQYFITFLSSLC